MTKERPTWLVRLTDEIRKRTTGTNALSYRQLSISAGLGPNFITQLLSDDNWKLPHFENVVRLCDALNVSITYIATGANVTQREEEILRQLARLDDQQRERLLSLLQTLPQGSAPSQ